jgi:hypothetical protein
MVTSRKLAVAVVAVIALMAGAAAGCTPQQQAEAPKALGDLAGFLVAVLVANIVCSASGCPSPICVFVPCDPGGAPPPTTVVDPPPPVREVGGA